MAKSNKNILTLGLILAIVVAGLSFAFVKYKEASNKNTSKALVAITNKNENKKTNLNTNESVINTNTTLNTNVNLVTDSRCEEKARTTDCEDAATPGYWYVGELGSCYYTSGEVCSSPPFKTHDECVTACIGGGNANTNAS